MGYREESKQTGTSVTIDGKTGKEALETTTTSTAVYETSVINVNSNSSVEVQPQQTKRPYSRQNLIDCVSTLYGVTLTAIDDDGSDYEFSVSGHYETNGWLGKSKAELRYTTKSNVYGGTALGAYSGGSPFAEGLTIRHTWTNAALWFIPGVQAWDYNENYVASEFKDVPDANATLVAQRVWVYELGNELYHNLDKELALEETAGDREKLSQDGKVLPKDDVGFILEKCVYGFASPRKTAPLP